LANTYATNPIFLNVFSPAIGSLCAAIGWATGTPLKIRAIEWAAPANVGDTAVITDKPSGNNIFIETCFVAKQNITNYYDTYVTDLYIANNGVQSGQIFVTLA